MKHTHSFRIYAGFLALVALLGCSKKITLTEMQSGYSMLSEELKGEIKKVEKSVIGVNATIKYEILTYDYELSHGKLIPDQTSPVKYKLKQDGILTSSDEKMLSGGGLIIKQDFDKKVYIILTSSHLVSPKDTTYTFYVDENGTQTDILFQKKVVKSIFLSVRGDANWRVEAELIANDAVEDIALILAKTDRRLGLEYSNNVGYDLELTWGDWVFLFGYPSEIKQLTGGWVSESPYRGTFAVDAVVRFGFSGGPVFGLSKDKTQLVVVGIIKSVPSAAIDYIAPDGSIPEGYTLKQSDVGKLVVKKQVQVNYGTAYCVNPQRLKAFLKNVQTPLENLQIRLDQRYFGS